MMWTLFFYVYIALVGLLIGSFLNVCALRLASGMSIVRPPSHCPQCKTRLGIAQLIPLFSYLMQKGRCKHCGKRISMLYPIGEALTASLYVLMLSQHGLTPELAVALLFVSTLVVALIADSSLGLIPFRFVVPAIVLVLGLRIWTDGLDVWRYAVAVVIIFAVFLVIDWSRTKLARNDARAAFGGGDIMLFLFVAATLGLSLTLLTLFLASVLGVVFALAGFSLSPQDGRGAVRFAAAILPAAIVSYLWGETLLQWYFATFS